MVYLDWLMICWYMRRPRKKHQWRLVMVLRKLKREEVRLNKDKCQFYATEITFLSHIVKEPDPEKTSNSKCSKTTNVSETRPFLGMLNQLNKIWPHLVERTKPIWDLLLNKKQWYWGLNQEKPFLELKESLCTEKCLALLNQMTNDSVCWSLCI